MKEEEIRQQSEKSLTEPEPKYSMELILGYRPMSAWYSTTKFNEDDGNKNLLNAVEEWPSDDKLNTMSME